MIVSEKAKLKWKLKSCLSKERKDTSNLKAGVKNGFQGSMQEGRCGDLGVT